MNNIQFIPEDQKQVAGFSNSRKSLGYVQLGLISLGLIMIQGVVFQSVLQLQILSRNDILEANLTELNTSIPDDMQDISKLGSIIGTSGALSNQASAVGSILSRIRQEGLSTITIQRVSFVKRTNVVRITVVASSVDELIRQEDRFAAMDIAQSVENSNIQSIQDTQSVSADINITVK